MQRYWAKSDSGADLTSTTLVHRGVQRLHEPVITRGQASSHRTRLLIEPGRWNEHDPFLILAEDWFGPGTFGDHPHRGFETITLVLDGVLEYHDNHGGSGVLGPGDARWLTTGRGLIHREEPQTPVAHTLQLWLNLPAASKMIAPDCQELRLAAMPVRHGEGYEARVYAGWSGGTRATTRHNVPAVMVTAYIEAGARFTQDLPGWYASFAYVVSGNGRFGVHRTFARAGSLIWFENEDAWTPSEITVEAGEPLRLVLFAAEPLGEPVAARGPFVMNNLAELQQACVDYREGRF